MGRKKAVTPGSVYDYDLGTGESTLLKRREVRGGFDPEQYGCARLSGGGAPCCPSHSTGDRVRGQ